jgi:hypothetical protein
LSEIASVLGQKSERPFVFNAFGGNTQFEAMGESDDRLDDAAGFLRFGRRNHEPLVDLQFGEWQSRQLNQ